MTTRASGLSLVSLGSLTRVDGQIQGNAEYVHQAALGSFLTQHLSCPHPAPESRSFVAQDWPQTALDANQIVLRAQHSRDVFVSRRSFIAERIDPSVVEPDASQLAHELPAGDPPAGVVPAHRAAGAV